MLEWELQLERGLFFWLNGSNSAFWDHFFYMYSYKWAWLFFYLCFLVVFIYRKNPKEIVCILLAVTLVILLCDQISSDFFKPFFHRFRPTHHPDFQDKVKTVLEYRGGLYGFVSSHAANACGFATFTALVFRNKIFTCTMILFALLNIYSRIYLGVHFISDVVAGALLGIGIGCFVYQIYNFVQRKWLKTKEEENIKLPYDKSKAYFLCSAFGLTVIFLLSFSNQLIEIIFCN
jgi:undecaprenyl-diphosphatase